jgi:probable phosphoglycerate mutase
MVRHGESEWNVARIVQGQNDTSHLTPLGRAQANDVADALRNLSFDHLVTSDLHRARQTADIIGASLGLSPTLDELLRERCFGVFEGGPGNELTSTATGHARGVVLDANARPPGGESLRDVVDRAERFVERASGTWPGERVLVVTHGGMINALHLAFLGEPLEGRSWYRVGNCEVWTPEGPAAVTLEGDGM